MVVCCIVSPPECTGPIVSFSAKYIVLIYSNRTVNILLQLTGKLQEMQACLNIENALFCKSVTCGKFLITHKEADNTI